VFDILRHATFASRHVLGVLSDASSFDLTGCQRIDSNAVFGDLVRE
jgi:hypothetical protein